MEGTGEITHYQPHYTGGTTIGICGKEGPISMHIAIKFPGFRILRPVDCPECLAMVARKKGRVS